MASLVRRRRRIFARAAEINDKIAKLDKALLDLGPFAPWEVKTTLRLERVHLENELAEIAIEAASVA